MQNSSSMDSFAVSDPARAGLSSQSVSKNGFQDSSGAKKATVGAKIPESFGPQNEFLNRGRSRRTSRSPKPAPISVSALNGPRGNASASNASASNASAGNMTASNALGNAKGNAVHVGATSVGKALLSLATHKSKKAHIQTAAEVSAEQKHYVRQRKSSLSSTASASSFARRRNTAAAIKSKPSIPNEIASMDVPMNIPNLTPNDASHDSQRQESLTLTQPLSLSLPEYLPQPLPQPLSESLDLDLPRSPPRPRQRASSTSPIHGLQVFKASAPPPVSSQHTNRDLPHVVTHALFSHKHLLMFSVSVFVLFFSTLTLQTYWKVPSVQIASSPFVPTLVCDAETSANLWTSLAMDQDALNPNVFQNPFGNAELFSDDSFSWVCNATKDNLLTHPESEPEAEAELESEAEAEPTVDEDLFELPCEMPLFAANNSWKTSDDYFLDNAPEILPELLPEPCVTEILSELLREPHMPHQSLSPFSVFVSRHNFTSAALQFHLAANTLEAPNAAKGFLKAPDAANGFLKAPDAAKILLEAPNASCKRTRHPRNSSTLVGVCPVATKTLAESLMLSDKTFKVTQTHANIIQKQLQLRNQLQPEPPENLLMLFGIVWMQLLLAAAYFEWNWVDETLQHLRPHPEQEEQEEEEEDKQEKEEKEENDDHSRPFETCAAALNFDVLPTTPSAALQADNGICEGNAEKSENEDEEDKEIIESEEDEDEEGEENTENEEDEDENDENDEAEDKEINEDEEVEDEEINEEEENNEDEDVEDEEINEDEEEEEINEDEEEKEINEDEEEEEINEDEEEEEINEDEEEEEINEDEEAEDEEINEEEEGEENTENEEEEENNEDEEEEENTEDEEDED